MTWRESWLTASSIIQLTAAVPQSSVRQAAPYASTDGRVLTRGLLSPPDRRILFKHEALAKVFRAKLLEAIGQAGLSLPTSCPEAWVVDCKAVGAGDKALVYLGRYLYRGVIQEKDIVACKDSQVTFRYRNGKTRELEYRTVPGAKYLWLIVQHVLPKGFRRARNNGFLHPNSKRLIRLIQYLLNVDISRHKSALVERPKLICSCCGAAMIIIRTRTHPETKCKINPGVTMLAM